MINVRILSMQIQLAPQQYNIWIYWIVHYKIDPSDIPDKDTEKFVDAIKYCWPFFSFFFFYQ